MPEQGKKSRANKTNGIGGSETGLRGRLVSFSAAMYFVHLVGRYVRRHTHQAL